MLEFLKKEANRAYTENGAVTNLSTMSDCLDLFATSGAMRNAPNDKIIETFQRAFAENPDYATKILFYTRDARGGLGERRFFRVCLEWLAVNHPSTVTKNINYIAEMGRYDDILVLFNTPCQKQAVDFIKDQLKKDIEAMGNGEPCSLLAKWLPSVNTSSEKTVRLANKLVKAIGITPKEYRQTLATLRRYIAIIENNLREKDYTFDYSKQPSKAMLKYSGAFLRNDKERYNLFLSKAEKGEVKMNTSVLTPYDVVRPFFYKMCQQDEIRAIDTTWKNLPDFTNDENALVVMDGSGSMYGEYGNQKPIIVAASLAIYFAERNKGKFANHFVTFSNTPKLVEIKGKDILEKIQYCLNYNEVASTDMEKVFDLILDTAVKNRLPQSAMPEKLYIISDMEFNFSLRNMNLTIFENAKQRFEKQGYKLPQVIFWNVASRNRNQPVTMHETGTVLVSGSSPRIFSMVKTGDFDPYSFMLQVISNERYKDIAA